MDKIWYRNPLKSEVIGRCSRDEKTEWLRRTDKSRTLKKIFFKNKKYSVYKRYQSLGHDWLKMRRSSKTIRNLTIRIEQSSSSDQ